MLKAQVNELLLRFFEKRPDLFLVDLSVSADYKIRVVLDGDGGVGLQDCIEVSRAVEHNLDRETFDFSLEVTSAGATSPLELPRQFKKNLGRKVNVLDDEAEYEGVLVGVGEDYVKLQWKAREPKPVGKGKHTVIKEKRIDFSRIQKAKVVLKF